LSFCPYLVTVLSRLFLTFLPVMPMVVLSLGFLVVTLLSPQLLCAGLLLFLGVRPWALFSPTHIPPHNASTNLMISCLVRKVDLIGWTDNLPTILPSWSANSNPSGSNACFCTTSLIQFIGIESLLFLSSSKRKPNSWPTFSNTSCRVTPVGGKQPRHTLHPCLVHFFPYDLLQEVLWELS